MDLLEYKDHLIGSLQVEASEEAEAGVRDALQDLVEHLRKMDVTDRYMLETWKVHGQLPDRGLQREALATALAEYRGYDQAEQLPTVFLIDLLHAAQPQESFL